MKRDRITVNGKSRRAGTIAGEFLAAVIMICLAAIVIAATTAVVLWLLGS